MSFAVDPLSIALALILAIGGGAAVVVARAGRRRVRRERRNGAAVNAAIVDYFRRTGVEVSADCISPRGNGRYIAVIESEPMKRFRLSHIIEMTLRDHVRKTCSLEIDKVYWRFPIAAARSPGATPARAADEYINEGLENYKDIPTAEAIELPWEDFEQVSTIAREARGDDGPSRPA